MAPRAALLVLFFTAIALMPLPAAAGCIDPTFCFCQLVPNECEVLARAEVTAIAGDQVTLRVLENPFYDPDGLVTVGMDVALTLPTVGWGGLAVGQEGLFLIHPPGACVLVGPDKPYLGGALIESNGAFPCDSYLETWCQPPRTSRIGACPQRSFHR